MTNLQAQIPNLKPNIPTYLPLADAAQKYGLSEKVLTQLIHAGKIGAIQLPSGELLVAAENNGQELKTKEEIIAEEFAHLRDKKISASEASRKYSDSKVVISHRSFSNWAKAGYISAEFDGYRLLLNEAEAAYCAKIYQQKFEEYGGQLAGVSIFDEEGNPYRLKYPEVATQMRFERRQRRQRS